MIKPVTEAKNCGFVLGGHHPTLPSAIRKVNRAISIPYNALINKFMENSELEGTHKDHQFQSFLEFYNLAVLFVQSISLQMSIIYRSEMQPPFNEKVYPIFCICKLEI